MPATATPAAVNRSLRHGVGGRREDEGRLALHLEHFAGHDQVFGRIRGAGQHGPA